MHLYLTSGTNKSISASGEICANDEYGSIRSIYHIQPALRTHDRLLHIPDIKRQLRGSVRQVERPALVSERACLGRSLSLGGLDQRIVNLGCADVCRALRQSRPVRCESRPCIDRLKLQSPADVRSAIDIGRREGITGDVGP